MYTIDLPYGKKTVPLELSVPATHLNVISPPDVYTVENVPAATKAGLTEPFGRDSLAMSLNTSVKVAVVIPDHTRHLPLDILTSILEFTRACGVAQQQVTIVNGTGGHQVESPEQLTGRLGAGVTGNYRVTNNDSTAPMTFCKIGETPAGQDLMINEAVSSADVIIVIGLAEPHLWAGYSGHYKGLVPGVVNRAVLNEYHCPDRVGDTKSTYLCTEGNPTWNFIQHCGRQIAAEKSVFLVNYTLDPAKAVTGIFCGEVEAAFRHARLKVDSSMVSGCPRRYPLVVVTNGGHPADGSLYQSVKGLAAAAACVEDNGLVILVTACSQGGPPDFIDLLSQHRSPGEFLAVINQSPGCANHHDQWIGQTLAEILARGIRVALKSSIDRPTVGRIFGGAVTAVDDVTASVSSEISRLGDSAALAVMPHGFYVIPQVAP